VIPERQLRPGGGFTLIELLVAIAVLGISMTLVLGVYNSVFSIVGRVDQNSSFQNRSTLLIDQLQRDFFGIYKGKSGFFRAETEQDQASTGPILEFTTSSQLRFKASAAPPSISVVRYFLERSGNGSTLSLYRLETPLFYAPEGSAVTGPSAMVVGEHVADIRLSFKDRYGEFLDQWQARSSVMTDGPDDDRFPRLVKMELKLAAGDQAGAEKKLLSVSIVIPAAQMVTNSSRGEG